MARPSQEQKNHAADNQLKIGNAAASSAAASASAANLPEHVAVHVSSSLAVLSAAFWWLSNSFGRIHLDPPRDDFRESVKLIGSSLHLNAIADSPIREAITPLIASVDESARLLSAMMTAVERATGAENAGDFAAAEVRVDEAYEFAQSAGRSLVTSGGRARRLGESLEPYLDLVAPHGLYPSIRRVLTQYHLRWQLARGVIGEIERIGLSGGDLRRIRISPENLPIRGLRISLDAVDEANVSYGQFLLASAANRSAFEVGVIASQ